jgi:hypothetical protein
LAPNSGVLGAGALVIDLEGLIAACGSGVKALMRVASLFEGGLLTKGGDSFPADAAAGHGAAGAARHPCGHPVSLQIAGAGIIILPSIMSG